MPDKPDYTRLRKFVEAALTNPAHPLYDLGLRHSTDLQYYALHVQGMGVFEAITPEVFFESRPQFVAQLEQLIPMLEAEAQAEAGPAARIAALESQVAGLTAKLAGLSETEADPAEDEIEGEADADDDDGADDDTDAGGDA